MQPDKIIALTFDDGPNTGVTADILGILGETHTAASFFVIGENITTESAPVLRRAYDMGCEIGNHSLTHSDMTQMTAEAVSAEIAETSRKVAEITGERPRFFRPPYIAVSETVFSAVQMPFICGWGVDDFKDSVSTAERVAGVLRQARDGGIILLHDKAGNFRTVEAVRQIIPALTEQGYRLVTVSALFREKGVTPQPRILYSHTAQTTMYAE